MAKGPRPSGREGGVSWPRPGPPRAGEAEPRIQAAGKAAHAHRGLSCAENYARARGDGTGSGKGHTGCAKEIRGAGRAPRMHEKQRGERTGSGKGRAAAACVRNGPRGDRKWAGVGPGDLLAGTRGPPHAPGSFSPLP